MIGNTNIAKGSGGESTLKILNVVQNGILTRDGSVFSGFDGNNNLRLGARYDKGILSLDTANISVKDFGTLMANANTWEMTFKIQFKDVFDGGHQVIFGRPGGSIEDYFSIHPQKRFIMRNYSAGNNEQVVADTDVASPFLQNNAIIWMKFTGNYTSSPYIYTIQCSTDGINYTTLISDNTQSIKFFSNAVNAYWCFGYWSSGWVLNSSLDLSGCSLKINGEYSWKGVEEIKL